MVWSDERKKTHNRTPRTIVYPVNGRFVAYGVEVFRCSRRCNEAKKVKKKMYQNHGRWNCIPNEMSNTHTGSLPKRSGDERGSSSISFSLPVAYWRHCWYCRYEIMVVAGEGCPSWNGLAIETGFSPSGSLLCHDHALARSIEIRELMGSLTY